jgi:hypothetical protein
MGLLKQNTNAQYDRYSKQVYKRHRSHIGRVSNSVLEYLSVKTLYLAPVQSFPASVDPACNAFHAS